MADDRRVDERSDGAGSRDDGGSRDVEVPLRVYKTVTVFSTFVAVAGVVGGFLLIDQATNRATAQVDEIQPLVAIAGIVLILAGGATYAFSTRFRTAEMGKSKDGADEGSDDG